MNLKDKLFEKEGDLEAALLEARERISKLENSNKKLSADKKELQNEVQQLSTENSKQRTVIDDLLNVNYDLDNLIKSTEISTIFLDQDLLIRKITPAAQNQFRLNTSHLNSPIEEFNIRLGNDDIRLESYQVMESKTTTEKEVQNDDNIWFLRRISPFNTTSGTVEGVVISFIEIDALKKSESRYLHQNQAFEQVLDGTLAGYWDWMIPEDTEYMSPTFKKMFGYEDHEMENKPDAWQKIIHPDDLPGVFDIYNKHVETKGEFPYDNEVRYIHKDGSIVWVYCRGKVIEWSDSGEPIRMVGSHVNITKLKNYSEELERINHDLDQFSYIASHDLQEPLRNVTNYINLLIEDHSQEIGKRPNMYLKLIQESSNRMKKLIRGFLKFSRVGRELDFKMVDCNDIVNEVLDDMNLMVQESNAQIEIGELPELLGLKMELRQLFQNLIGNAIKFRKLDQQLTIKILSKEIDDGWEFSVIDNGIGMEKVDADKLFQIFQRMHINDQYEGEGIGLAICKKVVDLHKGKIWANSLLGEGTTFSFTITKAV